MAQNNLAVLETYLKDIIVSEESIKANVENREHIFEIKDDDKTLGFISLYDLKAYVFEHEEEAKIYSIKNIDTSDWKNIYNHPFFQRRRPQLVAASTLSQNDDDEFFILQKGQKIGPLHREALLNKIDSKEFLISDMVSYNGGLTWIKLFQVDGFERRDLGENIQLPRPPDSDFLNRPIENIQSMSDTTEAISSLAFLGNQKRGKTIEREREISYTHEKKKDPHSASIYKWLLVASVIGIVYFLFNIKDHLSSPFEKNQSSTLGEQSEVLSPTDSFSPNRNSRAPQNTVYDQPRVGKYNFRKSNPIRGIARKSFMESNKYIESTSEGASPPTDEGSNYYYDNAAPMEIDPIRAQISKENFENSGDMPPVLLEEASLNQELSE